MSMWPVSAERESDAIRDEIARLQAELERLRDTVKTALSDTVAAEAEVERLREELWRIAEHWPSEDQSAAADYRVLKGIARAALGGSEKAE